MVHGLSDLLEQKNKKILFAGIGNVLRSDDGAGVYISRMIRETDRIMSLSAEVSIENYIGKINSRNPDILVFIDCVDMKSLPGTCRLLPAGEIQDMTFNTHNISLRRLSEFFSMPVYVLGIQPENVDFGENISYIVKKVADEVINIIN
jgi:hydrogenase 3 maturation protease